MKRALFAALFVIALLVAWFLVRSSSSSGYATQITKGICYQFYNNRTDGSAMPDLACDLNWNATRNLDLDILKKAGVAVLRVYELGWDQTHLNYYANLEARGMQTNIPVSNYNLLDGLAFEGFQVSYEKLLRSEFTVGGKYRPCVHSIMVCNEPELSAAGDGWAEKVVQLVQKILAAEKSAGVTGPLPPITVPVSSGIHSQVSPFPGVGNLLQLDQAFAKAGVALGDRYVASMNATMPPDAVKQQFAANWKKPFMLTEYSPAHSDMTPVNVAQFLADIQSTPGLTTVFAFQYFDPTNKSGDERDFGMTCFEAPYEIDRNAFCTTQDHNCPPNNARVGNKLISAVASAFGGQDPSGLFQVQCGTPANQACVPKPGVSPDKLSGDVSWACGQIPGGCGDNPCASDITGTATFVFSKYYELNKGVGATCDFGGDATLSSGGRQECVYRPGLKGTPLTATNKKQK